MSICIARFRETGDTMLLSPNITQRNAFSSRALKRSDSSARTQRIWQWVPNCRTGDWESPQVPSVLRRNRGIFSEKIKTGIQPVPKFQSYYPSAGDNI